MRSNDPGRVLIAIPTLGRRNAWLRRSITSIQRQLVDGVTVLVIGPPGSAAEPDAKELGVEYIPFDRPGLSAAINEVWKTFGAESEYFAWLGDDDLLSPISLFASIDYLDRHPGCVAVYGRTRIIRADDSTVVTMRPGRLARALLPYAVNHVPQPGSVFRADAVRRVGYLDESLSYAMDQDVFLKLRRLGSLDYVPVELAACRAHPGTITMNRSDDLEERVVRERNLSAHEARRYARFRRPLSLIGPVYSSIVRKMPRGMPAQVSGMDYINSESTQPDRSVDRNVSAVPALDRTVIPNSKPRWKRVLIKAESFVVDAVVRVWDATFAIWDRKRRLSPQVLRFVEASESGVDLFATTAFARQPVANTKDD